MKVTKLSAESELDLKFEYSKIVSAVGINDKQQPLVKVADAIISCRVVSTVADELAALLREPGVSVDVMVDDVRLDSPVITAIVREALPDIDRNNSELQDDALVLPKELNLKAEGELNLSCGKSSIRLNQNGTITLKGVRITSRARGTNKIKGTTVLIN